MFCWRVRMSGALRRERERERMVGIMVHFKWAFNLMAVQPAEAMRQVSFGPARERNGLVKDPWSSSVPSKPIFTLTPKLSWHGELNAFPCLDYVEFDSSGVFLEKGHRANVLCQRTNVKCPSGVHFIDHLGFHCSLCPVCSANTAQFNQGT